MSPLDVAILTLEKMHAEAKQFVDEHDVAGEWLDADGSWVDWEAEADAREAEARRDTLKQAIDVLVVIKEHGTVTVTS